MPPSRQLDPHRHILNPHTLLLTPPPSRFFHTSFLTHALGPIQIDTPSYVFENIIPDPDFLLTDRKCPHTQTHTTGCRRLSRLAAKETSMPNKRLPTVSLLSLYDRALQAIMVLSGSRSTIRMGLANRRLHELHSHDLVWRDLWMQRRSSVIPAPGPLRTIERWSTSWTTSAWTKRNSKDSFWTCADPGSPHGGACSDVEG